MTPRGAHRDIGVHPGLVVYPRGTSPEQVLRGTVLFYPCSHMDSNSVFTGTGPEPLPGIPRYSLPVFTPGDVMMFIMTMS